MGVYEPRFPKQSILLGAFSFLIAGILFLATLWFTFLTVMAIIFMAPPFQLLLGVVFVLFLLYLAWVMYHVGMGYLFPESKSLEALSLKSCLHYEYLTVDEEVDLTYLRILESANSYELLGIIENINKEEFKDRFVAAHNEMAKRVKGLS
jgi:hypothetical protein